MSLSHLYLCCSPFRHVPTLTYLILSCSSRSLASVLWHSSLSDPGRVIAVILTPVTYPLPHLQPSSQSLRTMLLKRAALLLFSLAQLALCAEDYYKVSLNNNNKILHSSGSLASNTNFPLSRSSASTAKQMTAP